MNHGGVNGATDFFNSLLGLAGINIDDFGCLVSSGTHICVGPLAIESVESRVASTLLNKLKHIFGKTDHGLDALVEQFGGDQQAAYDAVQAAANAELAAGKLFVGPNGILPTAGNTLNINGTLVQLSGGRVMNGSVGIGSFSAVIRHP